MEGTPPVVIFAWSVPSSMLGHYEHARLYSKRNCPRRSNIPSSAAHARSLRWASSYHYCAVIRENAHIQQCYHFYSTNRD